MKPKTKFAIAIAIAVPVIVSITAWLNGYNFDHRGEGVAAVFLMTTLSTVFLAGMALIFPE